MLKTHVKSKVYYKKIKLVEITEYVMPDNSNFWKLLATKRSVLVHAEHILLHSELLSCTLSILN